MFAGALGTLLAETFHPKITVLGSSFSAFLSFTFSGLFLRSGAG